MSALTLVTLVGGEKMQWWLWNNSSVTQRLRFELSRVQQLKPSFFSSSRTSSPYHSQRAFVVVIDITESHFATSFVLVTGFSTDYILILALFH